MKNSKTKILAVLGTVCAVSVAASVGTAVYAYYVKHQLSQQNTINIGNATMTIEGENGEDVAVFSNVALNPYDISGATQFAPENYEAALAAAQSDNGTIADAKVTLSREIDSKVFYGLDIDTSAYSNDAQIEGNLYVTAYELNEDGTVGTPTLWAHTAVADAQYSAENKNGAMLEGNMGRRFGNLSPVHYIRKHRRRRQSVHIRPRPAIGSRAHYGRF